MTSFEYSGYFWLLGAEDKIIMGVLHYHPNSGIRLETIGNVWTPKPSPRADGSFQPYTICGRCKLDDGHNADVTLQDTTLISQSYPEANLLFEAKYLFIGDVEAQNDPISFTSVECGMEGLAEWYGILAFSTQNDFADEVRFEKIDWQDYKLNIRTVSSSHQTPNHFSVMGDHILHITTATPKLLAEFLVIVHHFRRWLNFALNLPVNLTRFYALPAGDEFPVQVFIHDPQYRDSQVPPLRPIFTYPMVREAFSDYLPRWLEICSQRGRALETYLGSFEATGISPAIRLLLVVQSLEMFHVDFVNQRVPQRYNSRQKRRPPVYTETGKISRIGSLEERVWDLVEQYLASYAQTVQRLIPELDLFIVRLIDTRNHYTHGDRRHEHVVHSPDGIAALIRTARALAFLCWLRALDFPPPLVESIISERENQRRFAPYA